MNNLFGIVFRNVIDLFLHHVIVFLLHKKFFKILFNHFMVLNFINEWLKGLSRGKIKCFCSSFRIRRFRSWIILLWCPFPRLVQSSVIKRLEIWFRVPRFIWFLPCFVSFYFLEIFKIQIQWLSFLIVLQFLKKVLLVTFYGFDLCLNRFYQRQVLVFRDWRPICFALTLF